VDGFPSLGVTGLDTLGLEEGLACIRSPSRGVVTGLFPYAGDGKFGVSTFVKLKLSSGSQLPGGHCRGLACIDKSGVDTPRSLGHCGLSIPSIGGAACQFGRAAARSPQRLLEPGQRALAGLRQWPERLVTGRSSNA
jgi:hypothetical protein